MNRHKRGKQRHGREATRAQVASMYAGMGVRPAVPEVTPPPCPCCTTLLDRETGWCERCRDYPLLSQVPG
jgi:hypothetical protein